MRHTLTMFIGFLVFALLSCGTSFAQGIRGSAHDFSQKNWNSTTKVCVVCHVPHNANLAVLDAPLWDHELTTVNFTLYASDTLDSTPSQPGGTSKLCLSCHDGVTAIDSYGGRTGTQMMGGNDAVGAGGELRDDHPISIIYDSPLSVMDPGLFDPITTNSGLGSTIDADMLFAGKVECASCHDVHNDAGNDKLLVVPNDNSDLCFTCHNK